MRLNIRGSITILCIFILSAGNFATAATVAKKGSQGATVKKDLPITQVNKNPQVTPVKNDSPVQPVKKSPQTVPVKKTPTLSPQKQPRLKMQQSITLKQEEPDGFCCINGVLQKRQTTSKECTSRRGSWYGSQAEAKRQCQSSSGYCLNRNKVILPTSQKRCDQLRGTYFEDRIAAHTAVVGSRQESDDIPATGPEKAGFCNAQGKTIPNISKLKCEHLKGTFFDNAHPALLAIAKEKQQNSGAMAPTGTRGSKVHLSAYSLQDNGRPVRTSASVGNASRSGRGQKVPVGRLEMPDKNPLLRDPSADLQRDGMFNPFTEDLRTPFPEGLNWGKINGWGTAAGGGSNGSPQRDSWANRAGEEWARGNYGRAIWDYFTPDNDIDQRGANDVADSGSDRYDPIGSLGDDVRDAANWVWDGANDALGDGLDDLEDALDEIHDAIEDLFGGGDPGNGASGMDGFTPEEIQSLISSNDDGNGDDSSGSSGTDGNNGNNDDEDDDDDGDDGSDSDDDDDSGETDDSGDTDSDDSGDDQGEDTDEGSDEGRPTGGDRGGRSGDGPSLAAQLSSNLSVDLSTGRKKHEKLTGGGDGKGHISTPVTQPGKGDEHQTDVPDFQTEPEHNARPGENVRPVAQRHATNPAVGPNAQPSVDYEDDGPGIIMNNGSPIRLQQWIIDDPRVDH